MLAVAATWSVRMHTWAPTHRPSYPAHVPVYLPETNEAMGGRKEALGRGLGSAHSAPGVCQQVHTVLSGEGASGAPGRTD